jgi:hypothetical protein
MKGWFAANISGGQALLAAMSDCQIKSSQET